VVGAPRTQREQLVAAPTEDQARFLKEIEEDGGMAIVAHSVDEIAEKPERYLH
jgi:hypothetical protein